MVGSKVREAVENLTDASKDYGVVMGVSLESPGHHRDEMHRRERMLYQAIDHEVRDAIKAERERILEVIGKSAR